ncbi:MAG: YaaL family protein [Eubacterium sp.]|nr:YaaL family protein [Eubacterium sp.]
MKGKKTNPAGHIREQLLSEIDLLHQSLETVNSNFENVSDPDLIDSYIYEMNALSFRYKYLLKQIRLIES